MAVPILINKPDLTIITPAPSAINAYLTIVIPAATVAAVVIVPVVDPTMMIDNFPVVTSLQVTVAGANGNVPYSDSVTLQGRTVFTGINNMKLIMQGQVATGLMGTTVTVTSCGQVSVLAE